MFTVVPREGDVQHPPKTEIIDHNAPAKSKLPRWKKGKANDNVPYDTLKQERDKLLEAEKKYRARIKELENENAELSKTYETTYQENKMLKGILQHGPDANKVKQLTKVKKEQKEIIDRLEEENQFLTKRLNELEEQYNAKDSTLDNTWNDVLSMAKTKRSDGEKVPIQGPFAGRTQASVKSVNNQKQELDSFDIQLDNIEKEAQILLNKLHQLQNDKEHIGIAINKEKGYITRNAAMNNALNEKLTRDLNKFAAKLEKLKLKHKTAKSFTDIIGNGHKHALKSPSVNTSDPGTRSLAVTPINNGQANKTSQAKNGKQSDVFTPKHQILTSTPKNEHQEKKTVAPRRPKTEDQQQSNNKSLITPRLNKTDDGQRGKKVSGGSSNTDTSSGVTKKENNKNVAGTPVLSDKKKVLTFSPEVNSRNESSNKTVKNNHTEKTSDVQIWQNLSNNLKANINSEKNLKKTDENAHSNDVDKNGNGSLTVGRYTHGPEPIKRKIKPLKKKEDYRYADMYTKRKENFAKANKVEIRENHIQDTDMHPQINFIDTNKYAFTNLGPEDNFRSSRLLYKYGFPVQRDSKYIRNDVPNDAVLTYLKNRPQINQNPVSFNTEFDESENQSPSPIPIRFIESAKSVGGHEEKVILNANRYSYNSLKA